MGADRKPDIMGEADNLEEEGGTGDVLGDQGKGRQKTVISVINGLKGSVKVKNDNEGYFIVVNVILGDKNQRKRRHNQNRFKSV